MPAEASLGVAQDLSLTKDGNLLGFKFNPSGIITALRNELGRYQSISNNAIKAAHQEMGDLIRERQIEILHDEIDEHKRAGVQRTSQYLVRALADEDYVQATKEGFIVNPKGYLDSSKARAYWRNLEEGSSVHVGREFHGFFLTGSRRSGPDPVQRDIELIQSVSTFGAGHGQLGSKQNPITKIPVGRGGFAGEYEHESGDGNLRYGTTFQQQSYKGLEEPRVRGLGQRAQEGQGWLIRIKNPIPAYHYLAEGIHEAMARINPAEIYRKHGIPISA